MITLVPLTGLPEVAPGADLAALFAPALADVASGTILVVTQKIVSKAEDRYVSLADIVPSKAALELAQVTSKPPRLVELVLRESKAVVRAAPNVLITRHRTGLVMANAGIDQSNLGPGDSNRVLLLPVDADASAATLRAGLAARGIDVAVVISDSFGRPWCNGVTNVAIGAAGLPALIDRRGEQDRDGRTLEVTQVALGDLIASAAGLAMGEGREGIPAVLVTGVDLATAPARPASALVRPAAEDLFR